MNETCIKVSGQWKYPYRALDESAHTIDFLRAAKRDLAAARRFLERAINPHDISEKIAIDNSGASTAAIESIRADPRPDIQLRQSKYLNNIVEQDHRSITRIARSIMGIK